MNNNKDKVFIFNWQNPHDHLSQSEKEEFADMCEDNHCPIIFASHPQNKMGFSSFYRGQIKNIPVYLSGSIPHNTFLKVRFREKSLTITKVKSVRGQVEKLGEHNIQHAEDGTTSKNGPTKNRFCTKYRKENYPCTKYQTAYRSIQTKGHCLKRVWGICRKYHYFQKKVPCNQSYSSTCQKDVAYTAPCSP